MLIVNPPDIAVVRIARGILVALLITLARTGRQAQGANRANSDVAADTAVG